MDNTTTGHGARTGGVHVALELRSPGEEDHTFKETDDIRLVGGSSRCSGLLQVKRQGAWRQEDDRGWDLKLADEVCRHLDCGSVVRASSSFQKPSWRINPSCINLKSRPRKCLTKRSSHLLTSLEITCSDSVRLVNGTSLCSGRLEVKSNQCGPQCVKMTLTSRCRGGL
ncbi:CD5 antigen-like [Micropterus salmoides]|uniref:CD5 antigen-like n=1 Tax=Micropterus salmoides TaxID=27706 RepID=UPI0018ED4339|nr:CD5 antigen-like [Micropterus salmoides]